MHSVKRPSRSKNDIWLIKNPIVAERTRERTHRSWENVLSFPTLILSITFLPNKIPHAWGKKKVKRQDLKSQNRSVHMNKSIKNDADIMLISVNISIMSLTESDTVFSCHQQGERTTRGRSLGANMDAVKVQTGTLERYICVRVHIFIYICAHARTHRYTPVYMHMCAYTHAYIYLYMSVYAHIYVYLYTCAYTYINIPDIEA